MRRWEVWGEAVWRDAPVDNHINDAVAVRSRLVVQDERQPVHIVWQSFQALLRYWIERGGVRERERGSEEKDSECMSGRECLRVIVKSVRVCAAHRVYLSMIWNRAGGGKPQQQGGPRGSWPSAHPAAAKAHAPARPGAPQARGCALRGSWAGVGAARAAAALGSLGWRQMW